MTVRARINDLDGEQVIANDRELLVELKLNDPLAARYLGKSRQAVTSKLQSKTNGVAPNNYFRLGDVIVLLLAARQRGHVFDRKAVLDYVRQRPRTDADADANGSLKVLLQLLDDVTPMKLGEARLVVFLLPSFETLQVQRPDTARRVKEFVCELCETRHGARMLVMESTPIRAAMAAQWLGLPERTGIEGGPQDVPTAQSNAAVDHYLPTVLVFGREHMDVRPYVLNDMGDFMAAPQCNAAMMSTCIQYMLEDKARALLARLTSRDAQAAMMGGH